MKLITQRMAASLAAILLAAGSALAQSQTPKAPEIVDYLPYTEETGFGTVKFRLYYQTADGQEELPADRLYYNILIDDTPLVFTKDVYEDIEEEMTDVLFDYDCFPKIFAFGDVRTVFFYVSDFQRLGVKDIYVDEAGTRHESAVAWATTGSQTDAIRNATAEPNPSAESYDLCGRRVTGQPHGITLRRVVLSDGTVQWRKVL